ncbi:MAG: DNA repair exonuclease [Halofilum sp. (in: g-proteobacteria)]
MALKLLAVGDLHLGRHPSRLPGALSLPAAQLGPAGAWERIVDAALAHGVDVVAFAGDVVEREHDFFEAYRLLQQGVERLVGAGIRVVGIAGNHDGGVLPQLADEVDGFELLGRGGVWQAATLAAEAERTTLWGWSFPQARVSDSPLTGATFERGAGINLGLLHCDRDQHDSRYAPVSSRALSGAGLDGWLLGHIHRPDALSASEPVGYLGSVTGLDPGEPGAHGPWLLTLDGGRVSAVEQWPLAPLRWEPLEVDLTDLAAADEARARLLTAVRALDDTLRSAPWTPRAVGLRVRFGGRCAFGADHIDPLFPPDERAGIHESGGIHYFIERVSVETLPAIALDELATRSDPPGLLARRLLLLDRPEDDPERRALIEDARHRLAGVARESRWQALAYDPSAADTADWLRRAARLALERMLAQRDAA